MPHNDNVYRGRIGYAHIFFYIILSITDHCLRMTSWVLFSPPHLAHHYHLFLGSATLQRAGVQCTLAFFIYFYYYEQEPRRGEHTLLVSAMSRIVQWWRWGRSPSKLSFVAEAGVKGSSGTSVLPAIFEFATSASYTRSYLVRDYVRQVLYLIIRQWLLHCLPFLLSKSFFPTNYSRHT